MNTKKRFTLFGGGGHAPSSPSQQTTGNQSSHGHDNDTASVTSDMTGGASWSDHIGANGKPSFMRRLARPFAHDNTAELIDTAMQNLYLDPDILEKKCVLSIKGLDTATNLEDLEHAVAVAEKQARVIPHLSYTDKTPEGVIATLPSEFFTPDFDPTGQVTEEIASWGLGDLTQKFMERIEDADTDKDMVLSRLADMIEEHQEELLDLMQDVFSVDLEVSRAANQVSLSRRKIVQSCEIIREGPMRIVSLQARRDRLVLVSEMVRSLKALADMRKSISSNITTGDLGKAAESSCSLIESLQMDSYSQFKCLRTLSDGIRKQATTIRQKTDKALVRLCARKFATTEYGNIVRSYLVLDYMAEAHAVQLVSNNNQGHDNDEDEEDEETRRINAMFDMMGCMEGLAPRVLRSHLDDVTSCLHTAVLEFLYASQHRKHKVAEAMEMASSFTHASFGEIMDLAEIPLPELYKRVTPDVAAQCIVRSCELLTDIVHNHYLITQWHYTPFDERNHDPAFLHRRAIDLSDVDVSGVAFDVAAAADNASISINISSNYGQTQQQTDDADDHDDSHRGRDRSRSRTASDTRRGTISDKGGEDEVEVPFAALGGGASPTQSVTKSAKEKTSPPLHSSSVFPARRNSSNTDTASAIAAAASHHSSTSASQSSSSSSFFSGFPSFSSSTSSTSAMALSSTTAGAPPAVAAAAAAGPVPLNAQPPQLPPLPPSAAPGHPPSSSSLLPHAPGAPPPPPSAASPPSSPPPPTSMFRRAVRWVGPSSRMNDKVRNKIMSAYESNSKSSAPTFGVPLSPMLSFSPKSSPNRKAAASSSPTVSCDPPTPSSVYGDSQTRLRGAQLAAVYQQLVADRSTLWEQLTRSLIELLSSVQFSAMIAMDDFLAITWAVNVMAKLGKEFCGSESRAVLACLREKSREYYYNLHSESFHILRQMVDSESWRSIPIRMQEVGGIVGIIERNLANRKESYSKARMGFTQARGRNRDKYQDGGSRRGSATGNGGGSSVTVAAVAALAASTSDDIVDLTVPTSTSGKSRATGGKQAILVMFAEHGNPLHFLTEAEMHEEQHQTHDDDDDGSDSNESPRRRSSTGSANSGDAIHFDVSDGNATSGSGKGDTVSANAELGVTIENRSVFLGPASSSEFLEELKVLLREEEAFLGEGKTKKLSNSSAATVVTQTCLNGLARYAGMYLQLMHMIPAASVDSFTGLCQLFDFYLAAVFWGFVPHEERLKIHRKQPKPVAAAPNQSKDFEALQSYMERVLNEFVRVSSVPTAPGAGATAGAAAHNSSFQSISQTFGLSGMAMPHMHMHMGLSMGGGGSSHHAGGGGGHGEDSSGRFGGRSVGASPSVGLADGGSSSHSKHSLDGSVGAYNRELDEQGTRGGSVMANASTAATGTTGVTGPSPAPTQSQGPETYQYLAPITPITNALPGESARLFTVLRVPSCVAECADKAPSSQTQNVMGTILSPLTSSSSSSKSPMSPNFFALHERIVAAESCWFASKVLSELKFKLIRLLPEQYLAPCEGYVSHFQLVSGQLRGLVYRAVSPHLVGFNTVLAQIADSHACGWESSHLRQNCHDWVTDLIIRCSEVWEYLVNSSGDFDEASEPVREQVWMEVCQAAFDAMLEGFSRVKKLSTEGRAAMAMDVTDLQAGLDEIRPCRPPRGKHYVDYYVRATYLQEEELIKWVQENWQMYAYRHVLGLLNMTLSSLLNNNKRLKEAVAMIDALYDSDGFSQVQSHGFGFGSRSAPVEEPSSVPASGPAVLPSASSSAGNAPAAAASAPSGGSKFSLLSGTGRAKKENEKLSSIIAKGLGMG